jgi:hypothetical protein
MSVSKTLAEDLKGQTILRCAYVRERLTGVRMSVLSRYILRDASGSYSFTPIWSLPEELLFV